MLLVSFKTRGTELTQVIGAVRMQVLFRFSSDTNIHFYTECNDKAITSCGHSSKIKFSQTNTSVCMVWGTLLLA